MKTLRCTLSATTNAITTSSTKLLKTLLSVSLLLMALPTFAASGITYTGRILDSNNAPVVSNDVKFTVTVYDALGQCWLYTEQRQLDLSNSAGTFSFDIGSSDSTLVASSASYNNGGAGGPQSLSDVFNNVKTFTGLGTANSCSGTYTPNPSDLTAGRVLGIYFSVAGGTAQALPTLKMNPVPSAQTVGGYGTGELLRVAGNVTHGTNNNTDLTQAQFDEFWRLVKNPLAAYLPLTGDVTVSGGNNKVTTLLTKTLPVAAPTTAGQVLSYDGTNWVYTTLTAGSVTSVTATAPVVAGGTASAPVISMPVSTASADGYLDKDDFAIFAAKQSSALADGKIWVGNGSGVAAEVAMSGDATIINTGVITLKNTGTAGTYGSASLIPVVTTDAQGRVTGVTTIAPVDATKLPLAGGTMTGDITMDNQKGTIYRELTVNGTNSAKIQAPASLAADYTLTLPADDGTASQFLQTDGSGNLTWASPSASLPGLANGLLWIGNASGVAMPLAVTGDISLSNAGVSSLAAIKGKTVDATAASTMGQIMYFDSAADKWKVSAAAAPADGQVLKWNDTTKAWEPAADTGGWTAVDSSYAAKGIVQFNTDAATSGVTVAAGVATVLRTSTGTSSQILSLDGSGVANAYGVGVKGATSGTAMIQAPSTFTNYSLTLPVDDGTANQVLTTDGSGILSWSSVLNAITNTATLNDAKIWVGNGSNKAMEVSVSGDATIANTGALTIANSAVTDAKVAAGIDAAKIGGGAVSNTEFSYLDGVTSAIQTQIDSKVAKAGDTMTGDMTMDNQKGTIYRELTAGGTNSAKIQAPAALAADYTLTLPADDGVAGQVLSTDGNGVLSWAAALTNALPSGKIIVGNASNLSESVDMSGDATISNTGALTIAASAITSAKINDGAIVDADVNAAAAIAATKIGAGSVDNTELGYLDGVTSAVQTQIDSKVAKAGDSMTGDLTMANQKAVLFSEATGGGTNYAKIQAPAALAADYTLTLPADDGTALQFLQTDGSGNLTWASPVATLPALADTKIWVGNGSSVAMPVSMSGDATIDNAGVVTVDKSNSGAASKIVQLDASSIGTMKGLKVNGSTSGTLGLYTNATTTSYDLTFPAAQGAANQVLSNNGSGVLSWMSVLTGVQDTAALTGGKIWVGNASNKAMEVTLSGDITAVSNAGAVTVDKTATGTASKILALDGSGVANVMGVGVKGSVSGSVAVQSAATTANYSLTLPAAAPAAGQSLQSDGSGVLSWVTSLGAITNTATLNDAKIWIGNSSNKAMELSVSGDATMDNAGVLTLKNTGTAGTYGSASLVPIVTTDAQGRVTGVTTAAPLDATKLPLAGGTMTGAIAMGAQDITNTGNISMAANKYFGLSANSTDGAVAGQMWYDGGVIKYFDGTVVKSLGVAGAGITSLNGLSGVSQTFAIGTSGTAPAFNSATTVHTLNIPMASTATVTAGLLSKTDYDSFAAKQSTSLADGKVWIGNGSNLSEAQSLSGDVTITNAGVATVDKTQAAAASKILQLTASSVAVTKGTDIGGAGAGVASIRYPNTATNTTLTLPGTAGSANQFLQTDGSGNLTWAAPAATLPALADTKIWVGNGSSVAMPVSMSGDATIDNAGAITVDKSNSGAASKIVQLDASSIGTMKGLKVNGSTSGTLGLYTNATTTSYDLTFPAAQGAANQVLSNNGSGVLSWMSVLTGVQDTAALTGGKIWVGNASNKAMEVTLSGDITAVSNAGAVTVDKTATGTSSKILALDGSGVANAYGAGIKGATSGTALIQAPATFTNYSLTLPVDDGTANQVLSTDGSGILSWASVLSGVTNTATLADGKMWIGNSSGKAMDVTMSGDATIDNAGALTLASTITAGTKGLSNKVPQITYDAKGRLTTVTEVTIDDTTKLPLAGGTMTGAIAMGAQDITNTGNITMAANKYFGLSSNATPSAVAGQMWYDGGVIKYFDGSVVKSLGVAGAGITNLNGLSGVSQTFAIGTAGTAPAFNSATTVHTLDIPMASTAAVTAGLLSKTDYDSFAAKQSTSLASAKVWVGNGSNIAAPVDLSGDATITNAGVVTVDKTQAGAASKILQLTASSVAVTKGADVGGAGAGVASIRYPNTATNTTLTLPGTAGSANQFLQTDGSGNLTWAAPAATLPSLADTKIWIGNGSSVAMPVSLSGDVTSVSNAGAVTVDKTATGTASKILALDGSSVANMKGAGIMGSTSGTAIIQAPATFTNYSLTLPVDDGTSNQVLTTDGSGILSWSTVLNAVQNTAALTDAKIWIGNSSNKAMELSISGDATVANTGVLTIANSAVTDAKVAAGIDAAKIGGAAVSNTEFSYLDGVTSAIQTQIDSKVAKAGDSMTGDLTMANQKAVLFSEATGGGTNYAKIQAPAALAADYTLTLPTSAGSSGQVLSTNGSGVLSWVAALTNGLSSGKILVGNASNLSEAVDMSGDATISNTGALTIAASAITSAKINDGAIVDADVNASAAIAATKLGAGSVDNTELGYLDGVTSSIQTQFTGKVAKAGDTMTGGLTMDNQMGTIYREATGGGTNSATIRAPAALAADYTLTLPADDGTALQFLQTDGNGNLTWAAPVATLPSLADTKIWVGNGSSVAMPVSMSGDATIDNAGAITVDKSSTGAASKIVQLDASSIGTMKGLKVNGSTSGTLGLYTNATTTSYNLTFPAAQGGSGQVLSNNGSGVLSWASVLTGVENSAPLTEGALWVGNASGIAVGRALSGDISGVNNVGAVTVVKTTTAQGNKILALDGSGVAAVKGVEILGSTSGSAILQAPTGAFTNYTLTLPVDDGTANQVLQTNGSGYLSWATVLTGVESTAGLSENLIWVGNASGVAVGRSLSGDITNVNNVGAVTIDKTQAGVASKILQLDSSGVANAFGVGLKGATSGTLNLYTNASTTSYNLTFPAAQGASGQVLANNGSGVLSWASPLTTTLADTKIWVGNGSSVAMPVSMSGDATIANTGAITIANSAVTDAKVATGIDAAKIGGGAVSNTEYSYLDGVTSAIQTQFTGKVAKAGDTMTGNLTMDNQFGTVYREATGGGTNSATIRAPAALAADYTLTLPTTDGAANEFLQTDGSGNLTWATPTATLPSLADTKIWIGNGSSVAMPVSMSGDATIANTGAITIANSAVTDAKVATGIAATKIGGGAVDNTEYSYLDGVTSAIQTQFTGKLAKAGDSMTGDLTMANQKAVLFSEATGGGTNYAKIQAPAALAADYTLTLPVDDGTSGQALTTDGSGVMSWATVLTAVQNTATLAAGKIWVGNASNKAMEVTLSGDVTAVDSAGAVTVDKSATGAANKIVALDGSSVGTMSGLGIKGSTSGTVTLQATGAITNYSLSFPTAQGASGQVLTNNGSGVFTWSTPMTNSLADTKIWVGNGSAVAMPVSMSGDATIANTGAITLATVGVAKGGTGNTTLGSGALLVGNGTGAIASTLTPTLGNVLYGAAGPVWASGTPDTAGLVAKSGNQTGIAGDKTWTGNTTFSGTVALSSTTSAAGTITSTVAQGSTAITALGNIASTTGQIYAGSASGSSNTINFNTGNIQVTSYDCASGTITLQNMQNGGSYTVVVTSASTNKCTFTDNGTAINDTSFAPSNTTRTASTHTVYTFVRVGARVYASWIAGFGQAQ